MLNTEVIQFICGYIDRPTELLNVALVSKQWYAASRTNAVWEKHATRVQKAMPPLRVLFEDYGKASKADKGTRIKVKKRRKNKSGWVSPKGLWFVFARYLMVKSFKSLRRYNYAGPHIFQAVVWSLFRPKTLIDVLQPMNMRTFSHEAKYATCVCTSKFRFLWLYKPKRENRVNLVTDQYQHILVTQLTEEAFWQNYIALIRNDMALVRYVLNQ
jgi:hypothetical protein